MRIINFAWKSIIIGIITVVSLILTSGILQSLGMKFPNYNGDYTIMFVTYFISGIILSVLGGLLLQNLKCKKVGSFIVLFVALYINVITQMLEGIYFSPGLLSIETVPTIVTQQFMHYLILTLAIVLLYKRNEENVLKKGTFDNYKHGLIIDILVSSLSYTLFYFVFGKINAMFFTEQYYTTTLYGLRIPSLIEILLLEPVRGIFIVLSILPLIVYLDLPIYKKMVSIGLTLFIIGGLLPMIQQFGNLPIVLVVSTTIEMFFQFVCTSCVSVYLIEKRKSKFHCIAVSKQLEKA